MKKKHIISAFLAYYNTALNDFNNKKSKINLDKLAK